MKFLSFGAGVQSTAVLLMMINGDLPKVDHAIFADLGWEPPTVYPHVERMAALAEKAGIKFHTVRYHNLKDDTLRGWVPNDRAAIGHSFGTMPFYVLNPDGTKGMLNRSCTSRYKAEPVEKKMKEILGIATFGKAAPGSIIQVFGISADEVQRINESPTKAVRYHYPLVMEGSSQDKPLRWKRPGIRREHCVAYNEKHGYSAPRSACLGCPFHSDYEWREIRKNPELWSDVVAFDKAIRHSAGLDGQCFLHEQRVPLDQVDLDGDGKQMSFLNECRGYCGI